MRSQWHKRFATAVAVLLALLGGAPLAQAQGTVDLDDLVFFSHRRVFALTSDQRLVRFRLIFPQLEQDLGAVSGLQSPDTALVGIDFRVQDGQLYGVGNGGGVYTLDTTNAQASLVNRLTVALDGTFFGVDFNPAADRLRIVSDTGQNLSHDVNAGDDDPARHADLHAASRHGGRSAGDHRGRLYEQRLECEHGNNALRY